MDAFNILIAFDSDVRPTNDLLRFPKGDFYQYTLTTCSQMVDKYDYFWYKIITIDVAS